LKSATDHFDQAVAQTRVRIMRARVFHVRPGVVRSRSRPSKFRCGYPVAPRPTPTERRMPVLSSTLDPRSQDFQDNVTYHRALVDELDARLLHAAHGGGDKARAKHTARGKLLVRDRITALLDPGSPFLEIAPLAAGGMYDDAAPAAGLVCGIGR